MACRLGVADPASRRAGAVNSCCANTQAKEGRAMLFKKDHPNDPRRLFPLAALLALLAVVCLAGVASARSQAAPPAISSHQETGKMDAKPEQALDTATPTPSTCNQYVISQSTGTIQPGTTDTGNHCDDCVTTIQLPF